MIMKDNKDRRDNKKINQTHSSSSIVSCEKKSCTDAHFMRG